MEKMQQKDAHLNAIVFSWHKTIFEPQQLKFKVKNVLECCEVERFVKIFK